LKKRVKVLCWWK